MQGNQTKAEAQRKCIKTLKEETEINRQSYQQE